MKGYINRLMRMMFLAAMMLASASAYADTESPQATLQQYIADLQKNPDDSALREKIIKLALTMNPKPVVPKEVVVHEGAAEFTSNHAKTTADFADAAKEYEQALLLAPWLANDYFNCGVVHERAEEYDAAVRNFNLYLIASPGARDTNDVLKRIGGLEYAGHKAAKESSSEAMVERKQNNDVDLIKSLDGARYVYQSNSGSGVIVDLAVDVRGTTLIFSTCIRQKPPDVTMDNPIGVWVVEGQMQLVGRKAEFSKPGTMSATFTISEDGKSVTCVQGMGADITWIFYREK